MYDIHVDHVYAVQIENTGERDLHSHEATKAVAQKVRKPGKRNCII